jgi:NAD(P)-dependent dehydrogenase (short-subunit alcohol dehydrogenase family)
VSASSLFRLDGRVAVVAGAGSGIGAAVALGCAEAGARVACLDVDSAAADRTAARARAAGALAEAARLDVCDGAAVDTALASIASRLGGIDAVISTPGVNVRKPLLRYTDEEFDRVVTVNLKGAFNVLRAAGRLMTSRGRGSIVLLSSIRSLVVEPGQGVYAATKAGIVQLVRAAATEFGAAGVRVNALAPGVVDTPLTAPIRSDPAWYAGYAAKSVLGRWARVDEMVGPALFLASDASSYVTGTVLFADGGWTAADGRFQPPGMELQNS